MLARLSLCALSFITCLRASCLCVGPLSRLLQCILSQVVSPLPKGIPYLPSHKPVVLDESYLSFLVIHLHLIILHHPTCKTILLAALTVKVATMMSSGLYPI